MANQQQTNSSPDLNSVAQIGFALQRKTLDIANDNMKRTTDFVGALMGCRSPADVAAVTQEFSTKQFAALQDQAKELIELATERTTNGG